MAKKNSEVTTIANLFSGTVAEAIRQGVTLGGKAITANDFSVLARAGLAVNTGPEVRPEGVKIQGKPASVFVIPAGLLDDKISFDVTLQEKAANEAAETERAKAVAAAKKARERADALTAQAEEAQREADAMASLDSGDQPV